MAKVEFPKFGVVYWKTGEAKRTTWLATEEAQDRKARALGKQGYRVTRKNR